MRVRTQLTDGLLQAHINGIKQPALPYIVPARRKNLPGFSHGPYLWEATADAPDPHLINSGRENGF